MGRQSTGGNLSLYTWLGKNTGVTYHCPGGQEIIQGKLTNAIRVEITGKFRKVLSHMHS